MLELSGGDPAPGETRGAVGAPEPETLVNVSAVLEADTDGDGFGDETQDQCPTDPSTQGPCPTPASQPTGERAAALAKCKKKHTARKRRKCRRRANQGIGIRARSGART